MKLDYIGPINKYGDNIVRLYDFNSLEAKKLRKVLKQQIIKNKTWVELTDLDFIEGRNCTLMLRITEEDLGITRLSKTVFCCEMTIKGYENMVKLLSPFCEKETKGYQYLYDIDSLTDFLLSPAGTW